MVLKSITVCVDYSDYLSISLPVNKKFIDEMLVITHEKDIATKKVCDDNGVEYIETDKMYEDGATFNKGKAMNVGLEKIKDSDWIVNIDADIVLPNDFKDVISSNPLKEDCLYSAERSICFSKFIWHLFSNGNMNPSSFVYFKDKKMGLIGYLFIYNANYLKKIGQPLKISESYDACNGWDFSFREFWPVSNRKLLPMYAAHLGDVGKNWNGRVTRPFK